MDSRTGTNIGVAGAGFTLVELLLAISLVVLLLGSVIFNFSGLQRGAPLDEGVHQIEALIRFARAHASSSGRQVQLSFTNSIGALDGTSPGLGGSARNPRLLWEPDPITRPGILEPLNEGGTYVRGISDLVEVKNVRLLEGDTEETESNATPRFAVESLESVPTIFPTIGFYPDGSSDSAEITIGSRSDEDRRQVMVQVQGIVGSVRHKFLSDDSKSTGSESSAQPTGTDDSAKVASPSVSERRP